MKMSKYWLRLLMFGILLGTVPVVTIGWISYSISASDIEEKVKEGNMQILHQTQMGIEQLLKTVEMAAIQFANSTPVTNTINVELSPYDFDEISSLNKGLNHLLTFAGVSDAQISNVEHRWFLSNKRFGLYEETEAEQQLEYYGRNRKSLYWINPVYETPIPNEVQDEAYAKPVIRMVLKIPPMPVTNNPRELLTIDILSSEIRNYINRSRKLGDYYIIGHQGEDILSDPNIAKFASINQDIVHAIDQLKEDEGFLSATLDDQEMAVTYRVSPYNGWVYVSIVSINEITSQTKKIAQMTLIISLAMIIGVGLIAFVLSRKIYSPVRKLVEYSRGMQDSFKSTERNDEFGLIEESLRKLSNTGKDLEQQVQNQFSQLKEFFVLKLFSGQISENDYLTRARDYGFPTDWRQLAVMTVQIDTLQNTRYAEKDRELLLYAINNIVGEILPAVKRFTPIVLDHSQVTVITSQNEDPSLMKPYLHQIAELIRSTVDEYLQLKVSVGISRAYDQISLTMDAYNETLQALKRRLSLGYDIIVHYEDIKAYYDLGTAIYSHLKQLEDQLVHAIKVGDSDRADALFQSYLESVRHKEVSFNEYPALMIQLISKVYQVVQEHGGSVNKIMGERGSIEHYMKLNTLDEIEAWFKHDLIQPVIRFLNEQAEIQYLDIANQMVKMIHEKYDQDISLDSCASILNYHPVYLSRVFKKEVGINFSEYLVEYRVNIAKKLLETTNMKISSIAEKLQYTNTSAFIRTFRRIAGVTPGQYREQLDQN